MKLRQLFDMLLQTANEIKVAQPFLCGGVCRDKYMNRLDNIEDIDLTNGEKSISYLASEYSNRLKNFYNITTRESPDGHISIYINAKPKPIKMDFSSNFIVPNIDTYLKQFGITDPTNLQREMFSRDFTCNSLLMPLPDLQEIMDPTKKGKSDIDQKIIRTCLSPQITLTNSKNRAIRAIYLACKLDFQIDPQITKFIKENPKVMQIGTDKVMKEKLDKAFEKNPDKAAQLITDMGVWSYIPISPTVFPYYQQHKTTNKLAYFQGGGGVNEPTPNQKKYKSDPAIVVQPRFKEPFYFNYDYTYAEGLDGEPKHSPGSGFYMNMHKFKSVQDFLKQRREKMKDKYKADDDYIEDTKENRQQRIDKMKINANEIYFLTKQAIDFASDSIKSLPILNDEGSYQASIPVSFMENYTPLDDTEGKSVADPDFGNDLDADQIEHNSTNWLDKVDLQKLKEKYLTPAEPDLYGLKNEVSPEETDAEKTVQKVNPYYGQTDIGRQVFEDKWNI